MKDQELWNQFSLTGRVEDYLRYRGVIFPQGAENVVKGDDAHGGDKTASHDRRIDPA